MIQAIKPTLRITEFTDELVEKFLEELEEIVDMYPPTQPILLTISSYGGDMYNMAEIYEALQAIENPIVTYCTSKAMSAGAIILATCGTPGLRFASPNASIMIHELSTFLSGNITGIQHQHSSIEKENDKWQKILAVSMGLKTSGDIRRLIHEKSKGGHDLYLTAKEAKALGVIDDVRYVKSYPHTTYVIASFEEDEARSNREKNQVFEREVGSNQTKKKVTKKK